MKRDTPRVWFSGTGKSRSDDATKALLAETKANFRRSPVAEQSYFDDMYNRLCEAVGARCELQRIEPILEDLRKPFSLAIAYAQIAFEFPESEPATLAEHVAFRERLRKLNALYLDADRATASFIDVVAEAVATILNRLPRLAPSKDIVALHTLIDDLPVLAEHIIRLLQTPNEVLEPMRSQLLDNMRVASGVLTATHAARLTMPRQSNLPLRELISTYFHGLPYADLLFLNVPLAVPEATRFEHTAIVAGSGWGKTQLLQSLIAQDLQKPDPPSLIILDPTGAMTGRIQRLALFNDELKDRILILDPAHSPALNMFDVSSPRFSSYTAEQKENVLTEIVGLFNYIFASDEYDLSSQMGLAFLYAVRLVLSRKRSTITDLRKLLEEAPLTWQQSTFADDIQRLDEDVADFFKHHFFSKSLVGTRASVARRLHNLIGIPAFRRMFTASANTLDLFSEMERGSIVLVNTNLQLLKEDGMVLFGRFVIAQALAAAFERANIPDQKRRPAFLIVDEAAPYFDATFEKLLTRVRQFKLGVVIAFQHLEQATDGLKSAIASNTSIKYAGGVGFRDRRWLAHEMETTPEFIASLKKDTGDPPRWTQYARFVRNYSPTAALLTVPFFELEKMPRMSDTDHAKLLQRNQARVSAIAVPEPAPAPQPAVPPPQRAPERPRATPPADAGEPSSDW